MQTKATLNLFNLVKYVNILETKGQSAFCCNLKTKLELSLDMA